MSLRSKHNAAVAGRTMTVYVNKSISGRPFFCSWSGGKDSCLALYHAIENGGNPHSLLTILSEDGATSRSHALPKPLIEKQARSLGLKPVFRSASWKQYEAEFIAALQEFKRSGIEVGVFGDIDWMHTGNGSDVCVVSLGSNLFIPSGSGIDGNCWRNSLLWDSWHRLSSSKNRS